MARRNSFVTRQTEGFFAKIFRSFAENNAAIETKRRIEVPEIPKEANAQERRDALRAVLERMAEIDPSSALDDAESEDLASFFEHLYSPVDGIPFRHMYSEVCEIMYGFLSDSDHGLDEGAPYKAKQLANSLGIVVGVLERKDPGGYACKGSRKLLDHINLELTRMRYMAEQNRALTGAIESTKKIADEYDEKIGEIDSKTEEKLKSLQKEYIAILGIFAAIIIAFTSGTTFSASVLQNIDKAGIYRLAFVVLSIGLFLFLMVSSLYMFLNRITGISNKGMWIMVGCGSGAFVASMIAVVVARSMGVV